MDTQKDQPMNGNGSTDHTPETGGRLMVVHRDDLSQILRAESPDHRIELYARLRTIITTATESIRTLKEENAALEREVADIAERNGTLERRLRAATVDLESEERALRGSADLLEQLLQGRIAAPQGTDRISEPEIPGEVQAAAPTGRSKVESGPPQRHSIFNWSDR